MPDVFELIQQLCPDGVEYKSLGEIVSVSDGYPFTTCAFSSDGYPVIRISDINDGIISVGDKFVECLPDKLKSCQILHGGEILVALSGSTGKAGYNLLDKVLVNQRIAIFRANINVVSGEYLKYILIRPAFEKYCLNLGAGLQKNLSKQNLLSYSVPVPPLPVQEEIVRILDAFDTYCNDMTAGLAGELAMRRKQFQYWQEKLLSFDDSVPRKALGEVASIDRGVQFNKKDMNKVGAFPVINGGIAPSGYVEVHNQEKNTLVISQGGASAGYVNWMDVPFWAGAHCYVVTASRADLSDKYLYYVLKVKQKVLQKAQRGSGIPALPYFVLDKLLIPIPPLAVQQEIVRVLDVFVELERELERELELRAKQFEYYRDHLLAFPEKKRA